MTVFIYLNLHFCLRSVCYFVFPCLPYIKISVVIKQTEINFIQLTMFKGGFSLQQK